MKAGVRRQSRPQSLDRLEQQPGVIAAAKAGLPRPGGGVKHRGEAVGDGLPVAVDERDIDGEADAGAGHHLPFERIAMQVDDSRQDRQAAGIDHQRTAAVAGTDGADVAAGDPQRGFKDFSAEQGPASLRLRCWSRCYTLSRGGRAAGVGLGLILGEEILDRQFPEIG